MRALITTIAVPALYLGLSAVAQAEVDLNAPPHGWPCCPFSDAQLKTDVRPLTDSTSKLLQLQGVTFNWKNGGHEDVGLIAQDVQKVYPQLIREDKKYLRVDYEKLVAPLIESVREMDARIKQLEAASKAH